MSEEMDGILALGPIKADIDTIASQGFEVTGLLIDADCEKKLVQLYYDYRFDCGIRMEKGGVKLKTLFGVKVRFSESVLPDGYELIVKSPHRTIRISNCTFTNKKEEGIEIQEAKEPEKKTCSCGNDPCRPHEHKFFDPNKDI